MAWDKLCNHKDVGGLGFRNLIQFNHALLAKQGWRLLKSPDSLAARIFKARYYPNSSFLEAEAQQDMSFFLGVVFSLVRRYLSRVFASKLVMAIRYLYGMILGSRYRITSVLSLNLWRAPKTGQ